MSSTRVLAEFCTQEGIEVDDAALMLTMLDTLGVSLGGQSTEVTRVLGDWSRQHVINGSSLIWGQNGTSDSSRAALLNGTAAHALDFDDASPSMPMHSSAVVWPALLAVADERGCSLEQLFCAATIGQASFRAIAEALPMRSHYPRGWHSTATIGRLAAALAVARLVNMSVEQTQFALGIAASMAAGSIANFGTMTKPLHAGQAAHDAVVAVQLAEAGLTANQSQLDHPMGFFALLGEASHDRSGLKERLSYWETAWKTDISIKRYPSCYGTHRAIDAMLTLRDELAQSETIEQVEITVQEGGLDPLIAHSPRSGLEAKFHLGYTVGLAATKGSVELTDFSQDWVPSPEAMVFADLIQISTAGSPPGATESVNESFSQLRVTTTSGRTLEKTVIHTRGDARNPISADELKQKAVSCGMYGGYSKTTMDRFCDAITAITRGSSFSDLQSAIRMVAQ